MKLFSLVAIAYYVLATVSLSAAFIHQCGSIHGTSRSITHDTVLEGEKGEKMFNDLVPVEGEVNAEVVVSRQRAMTQALI